MRQWIALLGCVGLCFCGAVRAGESYKKWSEEHAEAKKDLVVLMEKHAKLREDLASANEEKPEIIREWIVFLADKGDHNTNDYVEKKGKDAKALKRIHEKEGEQVRAFREWIRDHEKAAVALAETRDGVKNVLLEAAGEKPKRRN